MKWAYLLAVCLIVFTAILLPMSSSAHAQGPELVASFVDEDEGRFPEGPTWVAKIRYPSGEERFVPDPAGPIFVTSREIAAGLFSGTIPSEWDIRKEGDNTIAVFHSNTAKELAVPYGKLQVSATDFRTAGQSAKVADATWRFRQATGLPAAQPAQQPAPPPAPTGQLTSCPTSNSEASRMGGPADSWSLISGTNGTGWHFEGHQSQLTAPSFGRLDTPSGGLKNGQSTNTPVATFWCNG